MLKLLFASFLAILLIGCATYGKPITDSQLAQVEEGRSTKAEVVALFGAPLASTRNSDGTEVLSWGYSHVGFAGTSAKSQGLSVVFDQSGVVKSYSVTGMQR